MNEDIKQINIKDQILKKIESGEVHMKSKAYFLFKLCVLAFLVFLIFITSAFLISYIIFSLRAGGQLFLLGFGTRGFYQFLMALPWFLLVINVAMLLVLDWLLKSFKFGYKSPILYLFLGTLVVITVFGSVINFTSLHDIMLRRSEQKNMPFPVVGGFYSGIRKTHREVGVFRGIVSSISTSTFTIGHTVFDTDNDDLTTVLVPANMNVRSLVIVGDHVFIAGDVINNQIRAYGITKIVESN